MPCSRVRATGLEEHVVGVVAVVALAVPLARRLLALLVVGRELDLGQVVLLRPGPAPRLRRGLRGGGARAGRRGLRLRLRQRRALQGRMAGTRGQGAGSVPVPQEFQLHDRRPAGDRLPGGLREACRSAKPPTNGSPRTRTSGGHGCRERPPEGQIYRPQRGDRPWRRTRPTATPTSSPTSATSRSSTAASASSPASPPGSATSRSSPASSSSSSSASRSAGRPTGGPGRWSSSAS